MTYILVALLVVLSLLALGYLGALLGAYVSEEINK